MRGAETIGPSTVCSGVGWSASRVGFVRPGTATPAMSAHWSDDSHPRNTTAVPPAASQASPVHGTSGAPGAGVRARHRPSGSIHHTVDSGANASAAAKVRPAGRPSWVSMASTAP